MTTPLPPLGNLFQGVKAVRMAYERILPLENESEHPILIRILGRMLIHAPNDAGRTHLARDINQCLHNAAIFDLGRRYFQYFIKYFRTVANKPIPTPSDHSSHPSMDTVQDSILATIQQAPTTHFQAKDRALIRDNYRCQLTGRFDTKSYRNRPATRKAAAANPTAGLGSTECHHIIPRFIGQQTDDLPRIWLEPAEGADNVYNIGRFDPLICPELPTTVTFATDTGLPLPDPRYLALHAACAKVVLNSGAAVSIDSILRETEETKVLSQDRSSEGLLNALLYEHTHAWAKI